MLMDSINSNAYWDNRFKSNWDSFEGPAQSRFFSQIAIEHLPKWFIEQIKRNNLTFADWGCAQGDGSDVWASYIDPSQITGIDFSLAAIEKAKQRYPAIRFLNEDWLSKSLISNKIVYDIVFSSNTLEHFHKPYEVLTSILERTRKAAVLALPYKEIDRIDEHFFSFLPENIPLVLKNNFRLVVSRVIDCKTKPRTAWQGYQIILLYAHSDWIDQLLLSLNDSRIESFDTDSHIENLNNQIKRLNDKITHQTEQIAQFKQSILEQDQRITHYQQTLSDYNLKQEQFYQIIAERDTHISNLEQTLAQRDSQIDQLETKRLLEHERTIKLSDWAQKIDNHPFHHGTKKLAFKSVKNLYHALPISHCYKQKFKFFLSQIPYLKKLIKTFPVPVNQAFPSALDNKPFVPDNLRALIKGEKLNSRSDYLIFSVIDWHFRLQRPQHLARSLAKLGKRVFYFSNHFIDSPTPGYVIERLDSSLELYQIKLYVEDAPAIYFSPPTARHLDNLKLSITKFIIEFVTLSSVSIVQHAYWYPLAIRLPNSLRIYDCMDHHEGFGNVSNDLIKLEKEMMCKFDQIIVSSAWLEKQAQQFNNNIVIIRNAGEYEHFNNPPTKIYSDPKGRKIIGYYGAIAEWFDLELVQNLALAEPNALILLIGNDTINASHISKAIPNIIFIGEVPYDQLPFYLYAFDVCLLPFKISPLTLATNPVKIYEYLASGKPVVSVDLPEISQFENLVQRAKTSNEFISLVSTCLKSPNPEANQIESRKQFACKQTWNHRVNDLVQAIQQIPMPKVSVIVLTYNNLNLTKLCLNSLLQWSDYPNLEIIIVDNNSSDNTPDYLTELNTCHPTVQVIRNKTNEGFAKGNNIGLIAATGDYLVLLNNDTVVTPGWVLTMLRHLQADPLVGLIGAVTNNIGNEAKIDITYQLLSEEMLPRIVSHTIPHMGQKFKLRTAAFFCVMMSRNVFQQVGLLDENYGRGFFEDDDYCRRIDRLDLKIVCAEDVFIHHHLSASFNQIPDQDKQALFEKNRIYYESKWGKWNPHEYRH